MNDQKELKEPNKVYLVMQHEAYGESHVYKIFRDPNKANLCCNIQNKLDSVYTYFIREDELSDDSLDERAKALRLYEYCINTSDTIEQADNYNDKNKEWTYSPKGKTDFNKTEVIDLGYKREFIITAYSGVSFNKAREEALNLYRVSKNCRSTI